MSPEKFTLKLQEAFNACQSIATRHGHQELRPAHLLQALLEQEGGMALPLLEKGNAFIAVGALHLPGAEGLVELFRQSGYKVTPVN